jgi:phosphoesterase RecJ-like protein
MPIDWRPFSNLVSGSQSFIITSHMRPDCDAIGSETALALALRSLGKTVRIVNGDPVPPHIAFIDPNRDVQVLGRDVSEDALKSDVFAVLDTSAWGQLGPMADVVKRTQSRKVVIDHHVSQDDMGAEVFKDTMSESSGRLVLQAIDAIGAKITPQIASALFAAIATDTGWFRFASVGEATLTAAARLVAAGAKPHETFAVLYEQNTLARLLLQGRILSNVKSQLDGRLLSTAITQADLRAANAEPTDTEDVINRLLGVKGVEVALLLLELGPQETKISLRSRMSVDVNQVAARFGGGGHRAAAGVRYRGPLSEAEPAVLAAVREAIQQSPSLKARDVELSD